MAAADRCIVGVKMWTEIVSLDELDKSAVYSRNRLGPRTDP